MMTAHMPPISHGPKSTPRSADEATTAMRGSSAIMSPETAAETCRVLSRKHQKAPTVPRSTM